MTEAVDPFSKEALNNTEKARSPRKQPDRRSRTPRLESESMTDWLERCKAIGRQTREEAIEVGRRLGEDTAHEKGETAAQRIARAMAYAAWEWDGRPLGRWQKYKQEFGIGGDLPVLSGARAAAATKTAKREKL